MEEDDYSDLLPGEPQRQSRSDILYNALVPDYLKYKEPSPMPPPGTPEGKIGPPSGMPTPMSVAGEALPDVLSWLSPGVKGAATAAKTLGMFMGPTAKNWPLGKQLLAKSMEMKGHSLENIFDATGLFKGHEGAWRKEISDLPMKTKPYTMDVHGNKSTIGLTTKDFIDHPELFENYPPAANMFVTVDPKRGKSGIGTYYSPQSIILGGKPNLQGLDEDQKSALLHELMHGVQDVEGWQGGASYKSMPDKLYNRLLNAYNNTGDQELLRQLQGMVSKKAEVGDEAYMRVPGETEARNVQDRYRLQKHGVPYYWPTTSKFTDVADALKQRNINIYPTSQGYNMHLLKENLPGGRTRSPGGTVYPFDLPRDIRDLYDRLPYRYQNNKPITMIGDRKYPWKTEDRPRPLQFDYTK